MQTGGLAGDPCSEKHHEKPIQVMSCMACSNTGFRIRTMHRGILGLHASLPGMTHLQDSLNPADEKFLREPLRR